MRNRIIRFAVCVLVVGCARAALAAPAGLAGFWRFDEGSGAVARDSSGKNHHGRISGAAYVRRGKGYALRFDGEKGAVRVEAAPDLIIGSTGTVSLWFKPGELQGGLFSWTVGGRGNRKPIFFAFDTRTDWGMPHADLRLWIGDGSNHHTESFPAPPQGEWSRLALVIDHRRVVYYRDGAPEAVASLPAIAVDGKDSPLVVGTYAGMGKATLKGLIDDVRVYNRALSASEVLAEYRRAAASFGKDATLFKRPRLEVEILPDPGRIVARAQCALMAPLPRGAKIEVALSRAGEREALVSRGRSVASDGREMIFALPAAKLAPGKYRVRAAVRDAKGEEFGDPSAASVDWPGQTGAFKNVKVLNNLVWELINEAPGVVNGVKEYRFVQPKARWVWIECAAPDAEAKVTVSVDDSADTRDVIVLDRGTKEAREAMRFLPAGEHTLALRAEGASRVGRLVVRSIPEIIFATLLPKPHMAPHGPYDDAFMKKYVVPHVNTFVISESSRRPRTKEPLFKELRRRGYRFLAGCLVPKKVRGRPITVEEARAYLAGAQGMTHPDLKGVMADEYGLGKPYCAVWAEAWRKLHADPGYANRVYDAYVGRLTPDAESRELIRTLMDTGSTFAFKRYLKVRHNEEAARDYIRRAFIGGAREYIKRCPGSIEHITVCFGYFCAPNELLNVVPQANYKVYLDMQFNAVANAPEYWGAYGLMSYLAHYADEETIRWIARLGRHYGIEGNTKRACDDPFDDSRLLANGDFGEDTSRWTLSPAEPNSIRRVKETNYSWLQGRYQYTPQGDTALLMVRSAKGPNSFSQEIRNLEPGRTYTFRMITGEYKDLTKKEKHAVSIKLEGVEVMPEKSFTYVFPNCYSHGYRQYNRQNRAWMNYHWILFRARSATAKLTVSDWQSDKEPGGPIGQGIMYNFLQVHPYFEDVE